MTPGPRAAGRIVVPKRAGCVMATKEPGDRSEVMEIVMLWLLVVAFIIVRFGNPRSTPGSLYASPPQNPTTLPTLP
jgi:hypothetical protein